MQAFHKDPNSRGDTQMEQARVILLSGDLQHAYDTAAEVLNMKASKEVHIAAHALCGLLCHTLWAAHLQSGASGALNLSVPSSCAQICLSVGLALGSPCKQIYW